MSRNKDRVGSGPKVASPPTPVLQGDGNAFSFVIPTEFVDLPSQGNFYSPDHPLHGKDCVEIKQMTAKEEDILTSRTLLKKGVALERVIASLIVDKNIDPDSLLIGDKNAIIIATRVAGYGADYTTSVNCPECGVAQSYCFNLNTATIVHGGELETYDVIHNENGTFNVTLPNTGLVITFKMLTSKDEKNLLQGVTTDRKKKDMERNVTRQLAQIIVAVNESSEPQVVNYVVENLPSLDARHLRLAYRDVAPHVDLTQIFECSECDYAQEMEVPLTADFFWPDR